MSASSRPIPRELRVLSVLMTLVVSGTGLLAVITQYAPERSTRLGVARALQGAQAESFGITVFWLGLLPLALLFGSGRRAAWFGGLIAVLAAASVVLAVR
jgi:hypothetical protein